MLERSHGRLCLVVITLWCIVELGGYGERALGSVRDPFLELRGIWERTGYGDLYVIGKKRVAVYQYTRASCLQSERLNKREFAELFTDIVVQTDGMAFTAIYPDEPAFRRRFSRLISLPEVCSEEQRITKFVPTRIFDHVWHTFNDYYAFFKERDVDWPAQYAALRGQIDDRMSKHALFARLRKLLSPIDDGHVYIESNAEEFSPEKPVSK